MGFKKRYLIQLVGSVSGVMMASGGLAQPMDVANSDARLPSAPVDSTGSGLEEIVVTAQRREESLQKVPISVAVASAATLQSKGITDLVELSSVVPGLQYEAVGAQASIFVRGVGGAIVDPNNESSVATYVDGVYIAAPFAGLTSFNNIERIEVLKGPQGTLFGRNATGGVLQIITRDPSTTSSADVQVGYGNYDTISGQLYATTALTEGLAADLAVSYRNQLDGFGRNITLDRRTNRTSTISIRSKLLWRPDENTAVRLTGDFARDFSSRNDFILPPGVLNIDGELSPQGFDSQGQTNNYATTRQYGVALRVDHQGEAADFVSISSYRRVTGFFHEHADGAVVDFVHVELPQKQWNLSQEFQIVSPAGSAFDWVAGMFLYTSRSGYYGGVISGRAVGGSFVEYRTSQKTDSASAYVQATYEIVPRLKLTGGLRFTHERQKVRGTVRSPLFPPGFAPTHAPGTGFDKLTWRAAANYELAEQASAYLSYNRGIKSGGYNILDVSAPAYKPESLDAYEAGIKTELFDRSLRFNAAAFFYDYKNIQFSVTRAGTGSIENAAKARIKGAEFSIEAAPLPQLTINASATYLDTKYLDFGAAQAFPASPLSGPPIGVNASGNRTIYSPPFTATIGVDYRIPLTSGEVTLSSSLYHNAGFYYSPAAYPLTGDRLEQSDYRLLSASVRWVSEDEKYQLRLWGSNLTNSNYLAQGVPSGNGFLTVRADPRTYGITFGVKLD